MHDHSHLRFSLDGKEQDKSAPQTVGIALALNLIFAVVQLAGGVLTGSTAIMANAIHATGDCLTMVLAWLLEKFAQLRSNKRYSFGFRRLSLLSAVISGALIITANGSMLYHLVPDLWQHLVDKPNLAAVKGQEHAQDDKGHTHKDHDAHAHDDHDHAHEGLWSNLWHDHSDGGHHHPPNSVGMFLLAILGIVVNIIATLVLRKGRTTNERMLSWHMLSHMFGWIAVSIAAIVMMFYDVPLLDPILSVCILMFILRAVLLNMWEAVKLFLQAVPHGVNLDSLRDTVKERVKGVIDMHDMRVWSLDGASHVLSSHVVIDENVEIPRLIEIKKQTREIIAELGKGELHTTLEFEFGHEICLAKVYGQT